MKKIIFLLSVLSLLVGCTVVGQYDLRTGVKHNSILYESRYVSFKNETSNACIIYVSGRIPDRYFMKYSSKQLLERYAAKREKEELIWTKYYINPHSQQIVKLSTGARILKGQFLPNGKYRSLLIEITNKEEELGTGIFKKKKEIKVSHCFELKNLFSKNISNEKKKKKENANSSSAWEDIRNRYFK